MSNVKKHYNLIVAGGGLSGVAAAVSAARKGLNVLLIERSGCLGGAISNNLVYPFMKYWEGDERFGKVEILSDGIFTEMRETANAFERENSLGTFKSESFKRALDKMVVDAGIDVLFHTVVYDAITDGNEIKSVKAITKSKKAEFAADYFIDATGDGDLIFNTFLFV